MMKKSSPSNPSQLSLACSVIISNNRDTCVIREKSKYGVIILDVKSGILQLQFVSKLMLAFNLTDLISIFDRFVEEGKTTLRFKKTSQDVMVQTKDISGLKLFIKAIKSFRNNRSTSSQGDEVAKIQTVKTESINRVESSENFCRSNLDLDKSTAIKNGNGKRSMLADNLPNGVPEKVTGEPSSKRRLSNPPVALKKTESVVGKVIKRLAQGFEFVSGLTFEKCRITSFLRCEDLSNLTSLELIDCKLTSFPPEIQNIPNLNTLKISRSFIRHIDVGIFASLPKLLSLDLSSNQVCFLPLSIVSMRSLRTLVLRENMIKVITALPPGIVHLDLSSNPLNSIWANKLTKFYGDVDVSGVIANPDDQSEQPFASLRKLPMEFSFDRKVPSLFEFAARASLKHRSTVLWRCIPHVIVYDLERECICMMCNQLTLLPGRIKRFNLAQMGWRSQTTDSSSQLINLIGVTCQVCTSQKYSVNGQGTGGKILGSSARSFLA